MNAPCLEPLNVNIWWLSLAYVFGFVLNEIFILVYIKQETFISLDDKMSH